MSATPPPTAPEGPPPPPPEGPPGYRSYGYTPSGDIVARLPIPGNAELIVYVLALVLVALIALGSERVDAPTFVDALQWLTAAYLISRGIAKASRVLER